MLILGNSLHLELYDCLELKLGYGRPWSKCQWC